MTEPATSEKFDPYHKWLGISPKDQPPHHYRLLAIDAFESDADVISSAADKQMAHVRSYQAGKNSHLSQKILNEISAARICLLNPEKKAEYDRALHGRLDDLALAATSGVKLVKGVSTGVKYVKGVTPAVRKPKPVAPEVAPTEVVVAEAVADDTSSSEVSLAFVVDDPGASGRPSQIGSRSGRSLHPPLLPERARRRKTGLLPLLAIGVIGLVCLGAIAVVMMQPPAAEVASDLPNKDPEAIPSAIIGNPKPTAAKATPAPEPVEPSPFVPIPQAPKSPEVPGPNTPAPVPGPSADPVANNSLPKAVEPAPASSSEAEKPKAFEELSKALSDAKSAEDFHSVADDALQATLKAVEDKDSDKVKSLKLLLLNAARKSGDSRLYGIAALTFKNPENIKAWLEKMNVPEKKEPAPASTANPSAGSPSSPAADDPFVPAAPGTPMNSAPVPAPSAVAATPSGNVETRHASVIGSNEAGYSLGAISRGTTITFQYSSGYWRPMRTGKARTTIDRISSDIATAPRYQVGLVSSDGATQLVQMIPTGTAGQPFVWTAPRDYASLSLRSGFAGSGERLSGSVTYKLTIQRP